VVFVDYSSADGDPEFNDVMSYDDRRFSPTMLFSRFFSPLGKIDRKFRALNVFRGFL